jgi:hypothetical protein
MLHELLDVAQIAQGLELLSCVHYSQISQPNSKILLNSLKFHKEELRRALLRNAYKSGKNQQQPNKGVEAYLNSIPETNQTSQTLHYLPTLAVKQNLNT